MINHGSIEVVTSDNENYGVPITPLMPLDDTKIPAQVKARTGVTVGAKMDDLKNDQGEVFQGFVGQWAGSSPAVGDVRVIVWQTAD